MCVLGSIGLVRHRSIKHASCTGEFSLLLSEEWEVSDCEVESSVDFCHACSILYLIHYLFQVMTGGIFVLGPMLSLLVQLTGKLLNLNLLLVPTGEETQINRCSKGFMAQPGRMKNN